MSDYILCQVKRASLPFYVENISKNIYSIEELCYYFYKNIYLIDESIINERLCNWLKDELGLSKLYEKLYRILEKEEGTSAFILAIFREIHYLSHEEFKKLNETLEILEKQLPAVRIKKKGDYLVSNRMYVNAIRMYENALVSAKERKILDFSLKVKFITTWLMRIWNCFRWKRQQNTLRKLMKNCRLSRFADSISIPAVCLWMREMERRM